MKMRDFTYYNPTRIEFGKDKEKNIGTYIKEQGYESVLLVYGGGSIKANGVYDSVINSLKNAGIALMEFGGVVSNPTLDKVEEGIAVVRENGIEAILGVGGGSVVDSAKAIAAGYEYKGEVWDLFMHKAQIQAALPVFTVMTLAAAASEMNGNAVITNTKTQQKYSIASVLLNPVVSVVNPALMASVPKAYLAYSAVDIIAHSIEVYFTASYHPHFNSRLVESILKTVMETTEILLEDSSDYDARGEFAWTAMQALNGLLPSGTQGGGFPNHLIEHSLSALFNVPHGAGLAVVIPAWMKWYKTQNMPQFIRFAKEVFGVQSADEGIARLQQWFTHIGAPVTLEEAGIPASQRGAIAKNAAQTAKVWGMDSIYSEAVILEILQKA
jgi:NADP-dependent alcohol dehydrogenase